MCFAATQFFAFADEFCGSSEVAFSIEIESSAKYSVTLAKKKHYKTFSEIGWKI